MNNTEAINWRYAVRKFTPERIEEDKLIELLTATRLSAGLYGIQPWRMVVVDDIDTRKRQYKPVSDVFGTRYKFQEASISGGQRSAVSKIRQIAGGSR